MKKFAVPSLGVVIGLVIYAILTIGPYEFGSRIYSFGHRTQVRDWNSLPIETQAKFLVALYSRPLKGGGDLPSVNILAANRPKEKLPTIRFARKNMRGKIHQAWKPEVILSDSIPPTKILRWMVGSGNSSIMARDGLVGMWRGSQLACVEVANNTSFERGWYPRLDPLSYHRIVMEPEGNDPWLDREARKIERIGAEKGRPTTCAVFSVQKG